jgi:phage tail sheath protein FI
LGGGVDETYPTTAQEFKDIALGGTGAGYKAFSDPEQVDVNLIIGGPEYSPSNTTITDTVAASLKDIAETRKDCVVFCSAPISNPYRTEDDKLSIAKNYRNNIGSSSYVFIDSGYKYMYDIYNDKYRFVPLCGDIAGLCARTDTNTDPWYSPAGFNRGNIKGVVKLSFNPTQTFRDELYKNNINPVVTFPGEGTVLYGDKTAQAKPSAFDRINVRRLFIVLEKAIATASKYSLFEFNDSFTRAQFVSLVEPFLRDVQARRGVIDFKVVCNERNNTPEVIDSNRFVADIYIKPARSINFIQLNFIATRTGVSFSEVGA